MNSTALNSYSRKFVFGLAMLFVLLFSTAVDAASKRLGSGNSSGKQSTIATQRQATPPQAAPAAPAAPVAAQPQGNRWLGPIAGLAAGIGLAALFSHFGLGEGLANFVMIALLALAVVFVVRWFISRNRAVRQELNLMPQTAAPGSLSPSPNTFYNPQKNTSLFGSLSTAPMVQRPWGIPSDFDVIGFEESAKKQFKMLQGANDAGQLEILREYSSPEMFEIFEAEIKNRTETSITEVLNLHAELLGIETVDGQYLASVRFTGQVKSGRDQPVETVDESWNLSKPLNGSEGWILAGIQQMRT